MQSFPRELIDTRRQSVLFLMVFFLFVATIISQVAIAADSVSITPKVKRFRLNCPLPSEAKCLTSRLIPFGYTVLSEKIDVEIYGNSWLIDFKKAKNSSSNRAELRIVSENGETYLIEAIFPEEKNAPASPVPPVTIPSDQQNTNGGQNRTDVNGPPRSPGNKAQDKQAKNDVFRKGLVYADSQGYCDEIRKNPALQKYAASLQKFYSYKGKVSESIYDNNRPHFDSADRRLERFAESKVENTNSSNIADLLADCAIQLKDTNLFPLFGVGKAELEKYVAEKRLAAPSSPSAKAIPNEKELKALMRSDANPFFNYRYRKAITNKGDSPVLSAILFEGGREEVKSMEKEVFDGLNKKLANLKSALDEATKQEAENKKAATDLASRLKKIRKGDLKVANNCLDVAFGLAANLDDQLLPAISPNSEVRGVTAKLRDYDEGNLMKGGVGKLSDSGKFGIFKTGSKTLWFDKDQISPGNSNIFVVGRYVKNEQIALTNGSSQKAPVFDALCISLDPKYLLMANLGLYLSAGDLLDKDEKN